MSENTGSSFVPFSRVIPELDHSLRDYQRANVEKATRLRDEFCAQLARLPLARHLCFFDMTFFSQDPVDAETAWTIAAAPNENVLRLYNQRLELYLKEGALALHEEFRNGLRQHNALTEEQSERFLWTSFSPTHFPGEASDSPNVTFVHSTFNAGLSHNRSNVREFREYYERVQRLPVDYHWKRFINALRLPQNNSELQLLSSCGGSLAAVVAAPIGVPIHSDRRYLLLSTIFFGLDENAAGLHDAISLLKNITPTLYRENAALFGADFGKNRTRSQLDHLVPNSLVAALGALYNHADTCGGFKVPVGLYEFAVSAAITARRTGTSDFFRYVPRIECVEKPLTEHGFTKDVLSFLTEEIARPAAIARTKGLLRPEALQTIKVTCISPLGPERFIQTGEVSLACLIAVFIALLREAIQHTGDLLAKNPDLSVADLGVWVNSDDAAGTITVENPCSSEATTETWLGGQADEGLNLFQPEILPWNLLGPEIRLSRGDSHVWTTTLRYTGVAKS